MIVLPNQWQESKRDEVEATDVQTGASKADANPPQQNRQSTNTQVKRLCLFHLE